MGKNIRGPVVVVASLTLVSGCGLSLPGGDDKSSAEETVTVTSSSSSEPTEETSTATATATATADVPDAPTSDPSSTSSSSDGGSDLPTDVRSYADDFVRAWGVGDRQEALKYATATTVSSLFAFHPKGGTSWSRQGEVDHGLRTHVRYTDGDGGVLTVFVDREEVTEGGPNGVVGTRLKEGGSSDDADDSGDSADSGSGLVPETSTSDYCDALVRAWGAGRRSTAEKYASATAMSQLFDDHGTGGSGWSQTSVTRHYALYTNTDGTKLTLYFNSTSVAKGAGDGVYYAEFTS